MLGDLNSKGFFNASENDNSNGLKTDSLLSAYSYLKVILPDEPTFIKVDTSGKVYGATLDMGLASTSFSEPISSTCPSLASIQLFLVQGLFSQKSRERLNWTVSTRGAEELRSDLLSKPMTSSDAIDLITHDLAAAAEVDIHPQNHDFSWKSSQVPYPLLEWLSDQAAETT